MKLSPQAKFFNVTPNSPQAIAIPQLAAAKDQKAAAPYPTARGVSSSAEGAQSPADQAVKNLPLGRRVVDQGTWLGEALQSVFVGNRDPVAVYRYAVGLQSSKGSAQVLRGHAEK